MRIEVSVRQRTEKGGVIVPLKIMWFDGRSWDIQRVVDTCRSPDPSFSGIRYTVLINGVEKYLYRSNGIWYVNAFEN